MADKRPAIGCPACDATLFPADGRGRNTYDDTVMHGDACRCRWCCWVWFESRARCEKCGADVVLNVDDGIAHTYVVKPVRS